jgi:hypothetical protein
MQKSITDFKQSSLRLTRNRLKQSVSLHPQPPPQPRAVE